MKRLAIISIYLVIIIYTLSAGEAQKWRPTSEYKTQNIQGWTVLVDPQLVNVEIGQNVLRQLEHQLYEIIRVVPGPAVRELQKIKIWVDVKDVHGKYSCMVYHPGKKWLVDNEYNPDLVDSVQLTNPKNFLAWTKHQPWMILHELCHGYHDQFLGNGHKGIAKAYEGAINNKAYLNVTHVTGKDWPKAYALNNAQEYFAEISEAFSSVIASSIAAGTKTSTFKERSSLFDILSPPLKFFNDLLFSLQCAIALPRLIPFLL